MTTILPRISVIMPVYDVERYVAAAIQSVLDQSFKDFELIIIDDGGSDSSLAICRGFVDPRIRIISQSNRGLAGARNTGIMQARGAYIALLDSDDLWARDKGRCPGSPQLVYRQLLAREPSRPGGPDGS